MTYTAIKHINCLSEGAFIDIVSHKCGCGVSLNGNIILTIQQKKKKAC